MTPEKILDVLDHYDEMFSTKTVEGRVIQIPVVRYDGDRYTRLDDNEHAHFAHLRWMVAQMRVFIKEGRMDKVNRWLGFIQGFLWGVSICTIDEMRKDNRG